MNQSNLFIQNQLQEMTICVHRAHHTQCSETWSASNLTLPFSSIGLIVKGTGMMQVNDTTLSPSKGQLYLLPANTIQSFSTHPHTPYQKYFCHFDAKCGGLDLFEIIHTPLCIDAKHIDLVTDLFTGMIGCFQETSISSMIKVKQYMIDLLCYYLECCPTHQIELTQKNYNTPLNHAIHYLENHIHEEATVKKMAEIAGYHPNYFTKLFQQNFGTSPVQFIVRKKTEIASQQLCSTQLAISVIAESLGFNNQFYFSNFFKKQTGMTPTEYRNTFGQSHL
ncbi:MAG: AraC family transcriptional regulator [Niameybacter sp.]|uniref:AraC family transcriptional regulator n=1 Tax=Niameybacter sp. TaxID=2033640 RepID=UPI002FC8831A